MGVRFEAVVMDCADTRRVAEFWAAVFGVELEGPDEEAVFWFQAGEGNPAFVFVPVPDAKTVKNRVHVDLRPDDQQAEVDRVIALGARRVDIGQGPDVSWVVLADVEDNEFCVLRAKPAEAG
jgi:predicted enzyme related to lactoylglutathione lyase